MFQNDYEITSKRKFSNQNVQFWYLRHPALSNSLHIVVLVDIPVVVKAEL